MWSNYIIKFDNDNVNRTYNGMTNNINKRLNQHNNILSGGAKFTTNLNKKYPTTKWEYICIITGFENKSEAMKAEWRIKHPEKKKRSNRFNKDIGRIKSLNYILINSVKWTNTSRYIKEQKLKIYLNIKYIDLIDFNTLQKFNIKLFNLESI